MKLFLAVPADSLKIEKEQLAKLKIGLINKDIEHKFIIPEQRNILLVSLGDLTQAEFTQKEMAVKNIIENHYVFELKLSGIWAWPEQSEARLLWIGVQNTKELRALQNDLNLIFFPESESVFKPVLPVVRLRNHRNVTDTISPYKTRDFGKFKVERIALYEMSSGGAYPQVKIVKSFELPNEVPLEGVVES